VDEKKRIERAFNLLLNYFRNNKIPDDKNKIEHKIIFNDQEKESFSETVLTNGYHDENKVFKENITEEFCKSTKEEGTYEMFEFKDWSQDQCIFLRLKNGNIDHLSFNHYPKEYKNPPVRFEYNIENSKFQNILSFLNKQQ